MRDVRNEKLVFDNCVLSNFAKADILELLLELPCSLYTTREVYAEIEAGVKYRSIEQPETAKRLNTILELTQKGKFVLESPSNLESLELLAQLKSIPSLGSGETSAMVLAKELDGIFITDEKRATNEARRLGIKVLSNHGFKGTVLLLEYFRYFLTFGYIIIPNEKDLLPLSQTARSFFV